jgi:hypothetical protein
MRSFVIALGAFAAATLAGPGSGITPATAAESRLGRDVSTGPLPCALWYVNNKGTVLKIRNTSRLTVPANTAVAVNFSPEIIVRPVSGDVRSKKPTPPGALFELTNEPFNFTRPYIALSAETNPVGCAASAHWFEPIPVPRP